jgi:selenocysteine lyase/cysteine desulfurase
MPDTLPIKYEAASHNIIAIASLNASLKWLDDIGREEIYNHKKELSEYMIEKLSALKSLRLYLPEDRNRHISVVSFTHSQYRPEELAEILDNDFDIAVRCGYHCAPFVHKLIGTEDTNGTVRISTGYFNNKSDIDALVSALEELE